MDNMVKLSDDELSIIQSSLLLSIKSYEKYMKENKGVKVDSQTLEELETMKKLFERFEKEYF